MKKGYLIIALLLAIVTISACGSTAPAPTVKPTATPTASPTATPTVAPTNTPVPTPVPTESPTEIETARNYGIYSYVQELLDSPENPGNQDILPDAATWQKRVEEYENKVLEQAAAHFGLTVEEVDNIYLSVVSDLY